MLHPTRLLTFLALAASGTLAATPAPAEACGTVVDGAPPARALEVWPASAIAPDGVFLVTARDVTYCGLADDVDGAFADIARGGLYLEDDEGLATSLAVEWRGGGEDAALLRPLVPLAIGKTYRLELRGTTHSVVVVPGDELPPPAWSGSVAQVARGLRSQLILRVPFATEGVARVALHATPLLGGPVVTRLLPLAFDTLDAAPALVAEAPYRLELAAYDDLGRLVAMPGGALEVRAGAPLALHGADEEPLSAMSLVRLYALLLVGLGLAAAFWVLAWRSPPTPPED
jgi:hypothetical protein